MQFKCIRVVLCVLVVLILFSMVDFDEFSLVCFLLIVERFFLSFYLKYICLVVLIEMMWA